jgi:hypothetical protein
LQPSPPAKSVVGETTFATSGFLARFDTSGLTGDNYFVEPGTGCLTVLGVGACGGRLQPDLSPLAQ